MRDPAPAFAALKPVATPEVTLVVRLEAIRFEIRDLVRSVDTPTISEDVWMGLRSLQMTVDRLIRAAEEVG